MGQFLKNKMAAIYSIMVDVLVICDFLVEIDLAPYFVLKYDTNAKNENKWAVISLLHG